MIHRPEQTRSCTRCRRARTSWSESSTARAPIRSTTPSAPPGSSARARAAKPVALQHHRRGAALEQARRPGLRCASSPRRARPPRARARGTPARPTTSRRARAASAPRASAERLERSGGGDERLGQRPEDVPRQLRVERHELALGQQRVLGVAAVEAPPHAAHDRRHVVPGTTAEPAATASTTPVHSIPRMRGNCDGVARPAAQRHVLRAVEPNASTRTSAHPGRGSGRGTSRTTSPRGRRAARPRLRACSPRRAVCQAPDARREPLRSSGAARPARAGSGRGGAWRRSCSATSWGSAR